MQPRRAAHARASLQLYAYASRTRSSRAAGNHRVHGCTWVIHGKWRGLHTIHAAGGGGGEEDPVQNLILIASGFVVGVSVGGCLARAREWMPRLMGARA